MDLKIIDLHLGQKWNRGVRGVPPFAHVIYGSLGALPGLIQAQILRAYPAWQYVAQGVGRFGTILRPSQGLGPFGRFTSNPVETGGKAAFN